jgi:hypothetical protein
MKAVATKTADQLDLHALHRAGQAAHQHHQSGSCSPVGTRDCSAPKGCFQRTELPGILAKR